MVSFLKGEKDLIISDSARKTAYNQLGKKFNRGILNNRP